jgi:glycosyltransferase involved in cell wall biosynthesis
MIFRNGIIISGQHKKSEGRKIKKLSIVTAVLDSHEMVRRQMLHYKRMGLPNSEVEIIYVDDGSDQPIRAVAGTKPIKIIETHDKRPWTQPKARNIGVKEAVGEYLMLVDLDHIIKREVIDLLLETKVDLVRFKRYAGILDSDGEFHNDEQNLREYGLRRTYMKRLEPNGYRLPAHSNTFAIHRELYLEIGGVSERYCGTGTYPNREEIPFKKIIGQMIQDDSIVCICEDNRPSVYYFPNGKHCGDGTDKDCDPFGLFHGLNREGRRTLFKKHRDFVETHARTFENNPG